VTAQKLGLAVVGFGGMGREHVHKLAKEADFEVTGIFDLRAERQNLARDEGVPVYETWAELLADPRVAVVLVATPNDSHAPLTIEALEAGKHVICEKPVTMNTAELDAILAVAARNGRVFTVHQNRRWDDDYLTVRRILDEGTLGQVHHIETRVQGSRGIPGDWRKLAQHGGGMLLDWGVHLLDRLVFLLPGPIIRVYCRLHFPTGQEVDEGFHLFLTFADGRTALVEVGTRHFQTLPLWTVLGVGGTAIIHDWNLTGQMVVGHDEGDAKPIVAGAGLTKTMAPRSEAGEMRLPLPVVRGDVGEFYRNVAATIRGRDTPLVKNAEVRRIMALMEAAFESHRTGEAVRFEA
jgi:predicted dehydrogenase